MSEDLCKVGKIDTLSIDCKLRDAVHIQENVELQPINQSINQHFCRKRHHKVYKYNNPMLLYIS